MKDLIQKLVETAGPSGYEKHVRELVRAEIRELVDDLRVDALGNLIARKGQKTDDGLRIMLSAHMDEIGVMATHIDENGFVRFTTMGGVRPHTCLGGRVRFLNGTQGLIGGEKLDNADRVPAFEQLFIDVGASSRDDCPVKVGDVAAFDRPFLDLGNRLVAKAMDDRISVAVLIEALRELKSTARTSFISSSAPRKRLACAAPRRLPTGWTPTWAWRSTSPGPATRPRGSKWRCPWARDRPLRSAILSLLADPRVVNWMVTAAEKAGIPYQLEILEAGGTDARAIQLTRVGVPAGCVSIPCRYVHSPSEMVDYRDVQNAVRLILELVSNPVRSGMKRFICLVSLLFSWLLAGCGSGWFGLPLQGTVSPVPVGQSQQATSSQAAPTPGADPDRHPAATRPADAGRMAAAPVRPGGENPCRRPAQGQAGIILQPVPWPQDRGPD